MKKNLKNYKLKTIEIQLIDGQTIHTTANTINDMKTDIENKEKHNVSPLISFKKIKRNIQSDRYIESIQPTRIYKKIFNFFFNPEKK